ncbi:ImmA/IrrE family metallo-endopeptidase [Embleya sp. NPDC050154]|uniref:ImmA/IrrE family metallo-endopeptidase n=1 Tax=Embleya sp. NPDC050154 TaxID=3363988 RepID=UPI0037A13110
MDPDDLPADTLAFRKTASSSVTEVERVSATVREAYRVSARLLTEVGMRRAVLPRAEGDLDGDDIERLAEETRDALGIARDSVMQHLTRTCERAGIPVVPMMLLDRGGNAEDRVIGHFGASCWRGTEDPSLISYFSASSGDRQRFTIAHELGHLVLHPARRHISPKLAEQEAHRFAGALLVPRERAYEALEAPFQLRELGELKARWGVSMQALIMRSRHLEIIDKERTQSLFKQIANRGWRLNEPVIVHPEQPLLMRTMMTRRFGKSGASSRQASEELGLNLVLLRSLVPEVGAASSVATAQAPRADVVNLASRRRQVPDIEIADRKSDWG